MLSLMSGIEFLTTLISVNPQRVLRKSWEEEITAGVVVPFFLFL